MYRRTARKLKGEAIRAAKAVLTGAAKAPPTTETALLVDDLVSCPIPVTEVHNLQQEAHRILWSDTQPAAPRVRATKRKLITLKQGAQPGPSQWRNAFIVAVGEQDGGVLALHRWSLMWIRAKVLAHSVKLWTSAVIAPSLAEYSGEKPSEIGRQC